VVAETANAAQLIWFWLRQKIRSLIPETGGAWEDVFRGGIGIGLLGGGILYDLLFSGLHLRSFFRLAMCVLGMVLGAFAAGKDPKAIGSGGRTRLVHGPVVSLGGRRVRGQSSEPGGLAVGGLSDLSAFVVLAAVACWVVTGLSVGRREQILPKSTSNVGHCGLWYALESTARRHRLSHAFLTRPPHLRGLFK